MRRLLRLSACCLLVLLALGNLPSTGPDRAGGAGFGPATSSPAASSGAAPYIQHVVVVVLENEVLSNVWGHGPYERYLAANYGNATRVYATCHPSAPEYLAMFAAVVNQCGSDSWKNYTNRSLNVELDAAHLTWGAYAESLPTGACANPGGVTSGRFATRHVPALWMANVLQNQTYCSAHVLGSDAFNSSIANGTLANFSFYTPNLCDDGHDGCGGNSTGAQLTAQADAWLRGWLSPILNHTGRYSAAAERASVNHTAFLVTWDEGTGSNAGFAVPNITAGDNYLWCGQNGASGDAVCGGPVYTAVVSPYSHQTTFGTNDSTYGICRTLEWLFDLPALGNPGSMDNQSGFPAMTSLFQFPGTGYHVTVRESALPANATWWFNVTGVPSARTNGSSMTLAFPNGTYAFAATTSLLSWSSPNGSFVVNGTATNVSLVFVLLTYPVTFVEHGLPSGTEWNVSIDSAAASSTSNGTQIVNVPAGRHSYLARANGPANASARGSFDVRYGPTEVNVSFVVAKYPANADESGLPLSTPWWLNVSDGSDSIGYGRQLTVLLANGSYSFTAQAAGDIWSRATGTFNVSGLPTYASVSFTPVVFPVTFVPANLNRSAKWGLTIDGADRLEIGNAPVTVNATNGTHNYTVGSAPNAPALHAAGAVRVAGAPVTVSVPFDTPLQVLAFTATPTTVPSGGAIEFTANLEGGTPPYEIRYAGIPAGCASSNTTSLECRPSAVGYSYVVVDVSDSVGAATFASLYVTVTPESATGPFGLAPAVLVAAAAVSVAAIAVAAAIVWRRARKRV